MPVDPSLEVSICVETITRYAVLGEEQQAFLPLSPIPVARRQGFS